MITPWLILKKTAGLYRRHWKEILILSALMTFVSVLIFILYFIRSAYPVTSPALSVMFWTFLPLLTLNLLFMYVNFIHFLYKPQKPQSIGQLFAHWDWNIILKTFWLFMIFVVIFSLGFTFPLLILNTLTALTASPIVNVLFWLVTIILAGAAIVLFNYLQFAYTLVILRKNDNIKTVLKNSYLLIKNRWWNAFLNQLFVIVAAGLIFKGLMSLFIYIYPSQQIILIDNDQLQVSSLFLISYVVVYAILLFLNLNLTLAYNLEFFKLYEDSVGQK
ncbi:MAG TPA: hypothetical protein PLB38_03055 [bacterium]|nr:hypothetical protein [bacterium]